MDNQEKLAPLDIGLIQTRHKNTT